MMTALTAARQLAQQHAMFPSDGGVVLAAVSGGADSIALLHWLLEMGEEYHFSVVAAHLNHRLRGAESERDADFVRTVAHQWQVPLVVGEEDVNCIAAQRKCGIEEAARAVRYAFLRKTADEVHAHCIATAHNAQDNAETILFHLIRGSGLRGLSGIAPKRNRLIRPLLTTEREQLETYLRTRGIAWVEDSSNSDLQYARNRLRAEVIPVLRELNPAAVRHMGTTATIVGAADEYITAQAHRVLRQMQKRDDGSVAIDAAALQAEEEIVAATAVQCMAEQIVPDVSLSHTQRQAVLQLTQTQTPSALINLPDGLIARREYALLVFAPPQQSGERTQQILRCPGRVEIGAYAITVSDTVYHAERQGTWKFWLSKQAEQPFVATTRREGDRLRRPGRPEKSLKKILIDEKIPRHLRDDLPVIRCGSALAAFAGLGIDDSFFPKTGEPAWYIEIERI